VHERFPGTLPDEFTISALYTSGKRDVIHFIYTVLPTFKTSQLNFNAAALNGHVVVLDYCHSQEETLLLTPTIVACARMKGYYLVEEWHSDLLGNMQVVRNLAEIEMANRLDQSTRLMPTQVKPTSLSLTRQVSTSTTRNEITDKTVSQKRRGRDEYLEERSVRVKTNSHAGANPGNQASLNAYPLDDGAGAANAEDVGF
jgi:hypothetical protein